jgi:hypothetical protein
LPYKTLRLEGNPLDVVVDSTATNLIVSIDYAHEAGSTSRLRSKVDAAIQPLQVFRIIDSEWIKSLLRFDFQSERGTIVEGREASGRDLSDLFYPLENLRKIGGEE